MLVNPHSMRMCMRAGLHAIHGRAHRPVEGAHPTDGSRS